VNLAQFGEALEALPLAGPDDDPVAEPDGAAVFDVTFFAHRTDAENGIARRFTWPELVAWLREPRTARRKADVPGWSPCLFENSHRQKTNARAVSALVLDIDNPQVGGGLPSVTMEQVAEHLTARGLAFLLCGSWSHKPDHPTFRTVLPLAEPVDLDGDEHKRRWVPTALAALDWPEEWHAALDRACFDKARFWHHAAGHDGAMPEFVEGHGSPLVVPALPPAEDPAPKPKARRAALQAPGRGDFATLDVVAWFEAHGLYRRALGEGKHAVTCPWAAGHTSKNPTETVVFEATGDKWPSFHCSHAHCADRKIADVVEFLGDADQFCAREYRPRDLAADRVAREPSSVFVPNPADEDASGWPTTPIEACRRFVQVAGMDAIFDRKSRALLRSAEFCKLTHGRIWVADEDRFRPWRFLDAPNRATIAASDLVFAPGEQVDPPRINLFDRLPLADRPRIANPASRPLVRLVLELYRALTDDDEATFRWLLSWLAWPVQHLGAKLRSCVVCRGPQGTGKSMALSLVPRSFYGEHATVIGQQELESSFNSWASRKLYIVGEEVTSRAGVRDVAGHLKALVTEPVILVNQKHLAERTEANHVNFAFLSNDSIPLWLDADDRRAFVVDVPARAKKEPGFYTELVRELNREPEAWFQFLRDVWPCLADFPEQPVPVTAGKRALLERCRPAAVAFVGDWLAGAVEDDDGRALPVLCCSGADLYTIFRAWCARQGYREIPKRSTLLDALRDAGGVASVSHSVRFWTPPGRAPARSELDEFRARSRGYSA